MNIDNIQLREQIKLVLSIVLWSVYIWILPWVFNINPLLAGFMVLFIGVFLYSWLANYMHDLYHRYLPDFKGGVLFHVFGVFLFMDPQVFKIAHQSHHAKVHTYEDLEFFPLGEIKNKFLNKLCLLLELCFGMLFIILCATYVVRNNKDFSKMKMIRAHMFSIAVYSSLFYLSYLFLGVGWWEIGLSFVMNLIVCTCFFHHLQLIEHGFVLVDGSFENRSRHTRNLKPNGYFEKVFLFLTHQEPLYHWSHHSAPSNYTRILGVGSREKPIESKDITLLEYFGILKNEILK